MIRFSVVIPTLGRPTLVHTLTALLPQLEPGDEILVERNDGGMWGHPTRNQTMPRCGGSHLLFIDDDDYHLPDALALIRGYVSQEPDRVHFFAMRYAGNGVVSPDWPLREGIIGTPMFCVPNEPEKLGVWGDRYEGDYDFISTTMLMRADEPVVHEEEIAVVTIAPR